MDEVAFQEEVVAVLKKSLEGADVSSTGPPFAPHTASALCGLDSIRSRKAFFEIMCFVDMIGSHNFNRFVLFFMPPA